MDQARKIVRDLVDVETLGAPRTRADATGLAGDLDKVLRLTTGRSDPRRDGAGAPRDWGSALDLVRQAAAVVRESQAHVADLEAQTRDVAQRARDELRAAEARAHAAEARAQAAEARAREAEEWLRRLTDALHEEFGEGQTSTGEFA